MNFSILFLNFIISSFERVITMRLCLLITASAFAFLLSSCNVQEITKKNEVVTTQELSNDFQNTPSTSIDMSANFDNSGFCYLYVL